MSSPRLIFSRFRDYLHNDWRSLLAKVSVHVDGKLLAEASHGIVATGPNETDPLSIELLGLEGLYHELIFPGGSIGRRTIHVRDSFPRLTAINPNGNSVTAVLSPTSWGGDFSHIPSLNGQVLEFTVSTQPGPPPQQRSDPRINIWLRNSETLVSYQRTHHLTTRCGNTTQTSWNCDWLTLELDAATITLEQTEKHLTEVEIVPKVALSNEELDGQLSGVLQALSLLWMCHVNPIMSGFTCAELQSLTLHRPLRSRGGSRFVDSDEEAEREWLTKAIPFFASGSKLSQRTWQAVELVLDAHDQYRAIQTSVAIEHLARAYWTQFMGRGKNRFQMVDKLAEILGTMGQSFVDEELEQWRWYRDGSLHGNEDFLDAEPRRKMESWEHLDRLMVRLLMGIVGYAGHWSR